MSALGPKILSRVIDGKSRIAIGILGVILAFATLWMYGLCIFVVPMLIGVAIAGQSPRAGRTLSFVGAALATAVFGFVGTWVLLEDRRAGYSWGEPNDMLWIAVLLLVTACDAFLLLGAFRISSHE